MTDMSTLRSLFHLFPLAFAPAELPDIPITGIAIDSRQVAEGNLFIARCGGSVDGHDFIPAAVARGAAAIVGEQDPGGLAVPYVQVSSSIEAVTWLAAAFHAFPGKALRVVGVTGTDGKTTTCNLLHHILLQAGCRAGLVSTVNAVIGGEVLDTGFHVTTPDAPDVQAYLARMVAAGLTHVVLETTSHGLAQHRVDASQYDIAVVTNITHEHLDQHGTYEQYRADKGRLFQLLAVTCEKPQGNPRLAVLNRDDASFDYLSALVSGIPALQVVRYGINPQADLRAQDIVCSPEGIRFTACAREFQVPVSSLLVGEFNVSNILAAMCAAIFGMQVDLESAALGVAGMQGIPGRMEAIDLGQPFKALVDFAHTPNALRVAITAARGILQRDQATGGKVIAIFGSAGLRDKEKRRLMAETAAELADISILTAEDPRTESLDGILREMARGAEERGAVEGESYHAVPDRGEAIRLGVHLAGAQDLVLVCGKGHEQSMCFGATEYAWDDRQALRAALAEHLGVEGPAMPYLPTQGGSNG